MTYLSAATYQILLAIFVFYAIFFIVDLVHYFFISGLNKIKDDDEDSRNINIFVGHDIEPKKFKIK